MSVQALSWALSVPTGSTTQKCVLLSLANCHNGHTGNCHPRVALVAREVGVSKRTVQRALNELEAAGLIVRHEGWRQNGSQSVNHYTLNMPPDPGDILSPPDDMDVTPPMTRVSPLEPEVEPSEETYVSSADAGDSVEKTPLDLLWDSLDEHVQRAPTAKSMRKAYAKVVREMFAAGWTPDMVVRRARAYRRHPMFKDTTLSVAALAKWGEELDRGKRTLTEGGEPGADPKRVRVRSSDGPSDSVTVSPPSVSVLPPEENARRMRELAASLGGSVIVMDMNTGEIVEGALDGADGYLEGLSVPSSALPSADPTGAPGEPVHPSAGSPHPS